MTDRIAYTPAEAAETVGVSIDTIRSAYRSGVLPVHYVTPQRPVIKRVDLEAWIDGMPTERTA